MKTDDLNILIPVGTRTIAIPVDEVWFEYTTSSGPGGQNVNRVRTRATLCFDLAASRSITQTHKRLIHQHLAGRISREGVMRVTSRKHRSREPNRKAALARFAELLGEALRPRKARVATKPSKASKRRRVEDKRKRSQIKQMRGEVRGD